MRLFAGMFDLTKPYFAIDAAKVFTELSEVRQRGIELRPAGGAGARPSLVTGAVLMDPDVRGEPVDRGPIGPCPVG